MMKAGLIGCGRIAGKHAEAIRQLQDLEIAAVSDTVQKKMEAFLQHHAVHSNVQTTETCRDLFFQKDLDVIIITAVSSLHAAMAVEALKHGKHVILEKPMALSIQDADAIIRHARLFNRKVLVCHQLRYRPLFRHVKALMEEGVLGKPYFGSASIRIHRGPDYYESAPWRGTWDQDGGMLINQGIHVIDLLVWLFGNPEAVHGRVSRALPCKETEDVAAAVLSFENGAAGVVEANTMTQPDNLGYSLSLFCERGTIAFSGNGLEKIERWHVDGSGQNVPPVMAPGEKSEHQWMYEQFLEAAADDTEVLVNAVEGKRALETIFAMYQSHGTGRSTALPLPEFATSWMKEREI
ncbi:Gfo/Idh/MocA family protein [Salibacterium lacus]|uniref:Gfo/Idh/MocA family protein n=1 Tax=Salibacterium lacus TaxID=1898109 RepID=A0ABW5T6N7_9BACI